MPLPVLVLQWQKFRICSVIEPLFWRKRQKKQPGLVCKEPVNVDSLICTVISRELKWIFFLFKNPEKKTKHASSIQKLVRVTNPS